MKKGIAFLLAAVMCLGLVGCGEKAEGAKSVYNALKKEGDLTLEAEYQNIEELYISDHKEMVPILEQIVFRMPKEERDTNAERACYIEIYSSQEDMKKIIDKYDSGSLLYGMYSSGNTLLRIDGYVVDSVLEKYEKAFQKAMGGEVICHSANLPRKNESYESVFTPPNGVGANDIYKAFKKKIENIEFNVYGNNNEKKYESISFNDRNEGYDSGMYIIIKVQAEKMEDMSGPGRDGYNVVRGNVSLEFIGNLSDERIAEYTEILDKIVKK